MQYFDWRQTYSQGASCIEQTLALYRSLTVGLTGISDSREGYPMSAFYRPARRHTPQDTDSH